MIFCQTFFSALFQAEKDNAATHASLMQAPTSLRVRVSEPTDLLALVEKHEAKLNSREEQLFRSALVALETGKSASSMLLESQRAGDQEFAVKIAGGASMSMIEQVKLLSMHRTDKLREIRDTISGIVAELNQQK